MRRADEPVRDWFGAWRGERRAGGFTLIELLLVVSIVALLVSITLPALGQARATSRRLECLTNLKGFGVALELYRKDFSDLLPRTSPFYKQIDPLNPQQGEVSVISRYMDVDPPEREVPGDASTPFVRKKPYFCPMDRDADAGAALGFSYEYWAGWLMDAREIWRGDRNAQRTVTRFYEDGVNREFAVLADAKDWHRGNTKTGRNALYFGDWRADWLAVTPESQAAPPPAAPPGGPGKGAP
jgi:prepilin-type N-terminal cleavage/methylation domain-containing protein